MEDDQKNGRRPKQIIFFDPTRKTTLKKMEDDLKINKKWKTTKKNGRRQINKILPN